MSPGTFTIPLRRNAIEPMRLQLFALDAGSVEVPLDLSGSALKLEVRLYPGQPGAALLALSTGHHILVIDAVAGSVEIDWPGVRDAIAALPPRTEPGNPRAARVDTFAYDLLLIAADGSAQAVLEGTVSLSFGVTTA